MIPRRLSLLVLLFLLLFVSGCGSGSSRTELPQATAAPTPSQPPPPTATPAADSALIAGSELPAGWDLPGLIDQTRLLAGETGLVLETLPTLTPDALRPGVRIVLVLPPDPGVSEMARSHPEIRFIAVAIPGIQPGENLFTIAADGSHPEWIGFMAGYIAAITTKEWRVGVMTQSGSNDGLLAADAFRNGAMFFCGLCNPLYPPFIDFPVALETNPATTQTEWQPAADALLANTVRTAYIYPGVADPGFLAYLAQNGLKLIGGQAPPENLRASWIATLQLDYLQPVQVAWGEALAGAVGRSLPCGIRISDTDPALLGEGKLRLVNQVIEQLKQGAISPNTIP